MDRYHRQLLLPEIGIEGQKKLSESKVLIVGLGGLGSPLSMYLVGAGIGNIGIMEDDVVSETNLHRQILYTEDEVGESKLGLGIKRLQSLNKTINIVGYPRLSKDNAQDIINQYDIVVDACDNYSTRYLINDVCKRLNKPYIYGAVQGFRGQVSIFGLSKLGTDALWYDDVFPYDDNLSNIVIDKGIIGPTAGLVASIQATEVIKLICGFGNLLSNKLLQVDTQTLSFNVINLL